MADRKIAIVTAASRGIGEAAARRLAAGGYTVSLLAQSESVLELARELGGTGMQGSLAETSDLGRLVASTLTAHGRIDALVCNAGNAPKGEILSIGDAEWHDGLDVMMLHVIRLARLVTPAMAAQGGGSIVNVSSFGAREPSAKFPVSSVMRAGLAAFTKLFVEAHGGAGIRMNNVLPGYIENWRQPAELTAAIPARRLGRLSEVAATIAFLLSPDAAYITGQDITVDGGLVRAI